MEKLPQELIFQQILPRLSVKSLIRFKSVSKQWNSVISSSGFAETQLQRSSHLSSKSILTLDYEGTFEAINYDAFDKNLEDFRYKFVGNYKNKKTTRLIASCNGLVLLISSLFVTNDQHNNNFSYIVYNPCLRNPHTSVGIKNNQINVRNHGERDFNFGFGYVSSMNDYYIVAIAMPTSPRRPDIFVYVYSLRSKQWKTPRKYKQIKLPLCCKDSWYDCIGVLVNETLHWIFTLGSTKKCIGAFDLVKGTGTCTSTGDNEFKFMKLPPKHELGDDCEINLCNIDECLCVWGNFQGGLITMWRMNERGVWKYWFNLRLSGLCQGIFGRTESGKVLIVQEHKHEHETVNNEQVTVDEKYVLGDLRNDPPIIENVVSYYEHASEVVSYVQSLVSPSLEPMGVVRPINAQEIEGYMVGILNKEMRKVRRVV